MAASDHDQPYLQLSDNPIRFEPVSRVTNVFFDGTTKEVVSVRGGGTLGVVVQGLHTKETFCMEDRGSITSLKFAPDHSRLAVQRTPNSLELLPFSSGEVGPGVVVECKAKNATLLGFVWADNDDLVLVTSHGIEFYHVSKERVFVRLARNYSVPGCCWFVWSAECRTLVLASSSGLSAPGRVTLFPFQFAANYSNKMQKCVGEWYSSFGMDLQLSVLGTSRGARSPSAVSDEQLELSERDVCVAYVYRPAILVLRHPHEPNHSAQLLVFSNLKDSSSFKLTHACQLEMTGRFAVNVIDSLIIVHHQASKVSLVFDIALGVEVRGEVCLVYPATQPASIRPYCIEEPTVAPTTSTASLPAGGDGGRGSKYSGTAAVRSAAVTQIPCQLYAPTWVVFQPSVIIDARLGCLWNLQLDLPAFAATFSDRLQLVSCLLHRRHAKALLLQTIRNVAEQRALHTLGPCFDVINAGYRRHLDALCAQAQCGAAGPMGVVLGGVGSNLTPPTSSLLQPGSPTAANVLASSPSTVVVETVDMYQSVLSPLMEQAQGLGSSSTVDAVSQLQAISLSDGGASDDLDANKESEVQKALETMDESINYLVSVTLDYVRSLTAAGLPVPDFLHQLIVNALLNTGNFFQLHQLLQFHIVPDTKPLKLHGGPYSASTVFSVWGQ
ncbi:Colon cancer-associated Mic1-like [Trinorchestia longiramus]|nr:Colon cancer-associated Mic1-like [Trinorchestia longiramus]